MRRVIGVLGVVALVLAFSTPASAWQELQCPPPADFLTVGGFILVNGALANFGIGGACKEGGDGHGLWGHLEYIDHGIGLNAHWTTINGVLGRFPPWGS